MEYNFRIKHIKGSSNCTTDNLSRLPIGVNGGDAEYPAGQLKQLEELPAVCMLGVMVAEEVLMTDVQILAKQPQQEVCDVTIAQVVGESCKEAWEVLPLDISDVAKATREDRTFGKLFNAVRCGNLDSKDKDLSKFTGVFSDLYIEDEVLYFGTRVVIPTNQQARLLDELHSSHIGVVKIKETVRRYLWCPGITKDIEAVAERCEACRKYRKRPPPQPLCPWPFSRRPMERVHIDFCE